MLRLAGLRCCQNSANVPFLGQQPKDKGNVCHQPAKGWSFQVKDKRENSSLPRQRRVDTKTATTDMVGHRGGGVSVGGLFHTSTSQQPFGPFTSTLEKVAGSTLGVAGVRGAVLKGGGWQQRKQQLPLDRSSSKPYV